MTEQDSQGAETRPVERVKVHTARHEDISEPMLLWESHYIGHPDEKENKGWHRRGSMMVPQGRVRSFMRLPEEMMVAAQRLAPGKLLLLNIVRTQPGGVVVTEKHKIWALTTGGVVVMNASAVTGAPVDGGLDVFLTQAERKLLATNAPAPWKAVEIPEGIYIHDANGDCVMPVFNPHNSAIHYELAEVIAKAINHVSAPCALTGGQ